MSGIYIPGMDMPKSCEKCPCKTADAFGGLGCQATGYIPLRKANQARPDWCPLVPVPKHGRLIDGDALTGQMERNLWAIEDKAEKELGFDETIRRGMQYGHAVCIDAVNDAPTIIPADKEGER